MQAEKTKEAARLQAEKDTLVQQMAGLQAEKDTMAQETEVRCSCAAAV